MRRQRTALPSTPRARRRPAERGSVYLLALMVLVLLTMLGLALAVVTQTEAQIGASEKIATRNFYTADSGIGYSLARKQVSNLETSGVLTLDSTALVGLSANLANRVSLSPLPALSQGPCSLCSINEHSGEEFKRIEYALNSTAVREVTQGADTTPIAFKQISLILVRQPATSSIGAAIELNGNDTLRKSIRY